MSIRTSVTGVSPNTWTQIGTGPATVQLISPDAIGVEAMVLAAASAPATGATDGLVMGPAYPVHEFTLTEPIWASVLQIGLIATFAAQPEAAP